MKSIIGKCLVVCSIAFLPCMTGCQNNGPEEEPKEDNFLNENMTEFESATSELTSLTLGQDHLDKSEVEAVLKNLKKAGYVEKSEILDDYVHVEYANGLVLDYPVIPKDIFTVSGEIGDDSFDIEPAETKASSESDYPVQIFDATAVNDEERSSQHALMLKCYSYFHEVGINANFVRAGEFTGEQLIKAAQNPSVKLIIVSSHGYSGLVVTGETVPASSFKGLSKEELKIAMKQNSLTDIGTMQKGEHVYNYVLDPTLVINRPYAADKLIYYTGCNIMTEFNKTKFDGFGGVVAAWNGINTIGEAVAFCLTDVLVHHTFSVFKSEMGTIKDDDYGSELQYAGTGSDFSLTTSTSSDYLPYKSKNTKMIKPDQLQRMKSLFGAYCFTTSFYYDSGEYNDIPLGSSDDVRFNVKVMDVLKNKNIYNYEPTFVIGRNWFDLVTGTGSGLFRVSINRSLNGGDFHLYQRRYVLISPDFQENCIEPEKADPVVRTMDASQIQSEVKLIGVCMNYGTGGFDQGFLLWESGKEGEKRDIAASEKGAIFKAACSGLIKGKTYCAAGYVRNSEGATFLGNTVEFVAGSGSDSPGGTMEAVDLGLSVKLASCNLGASKPEEYGGYYQWGGLQDVTDTSIYLYWDNCPYHTGSSYSTGWTKYIPSDKSSYWSGSGSPDNKTVLDPEDDVAHVKLGGKWRIPTDAEWTELRNNCTWTWTTQNGVAGYKVSSKKNGNSIFLPAAAFRHYDYLYPAGYLGFYWSSSLDTVDPDYACDMEFNSGYVYMVSYYRYYGHSVRPVSE